MAAVMDATFTNVSMTTIAMGRVAGSVTRSSPLDGLEIAK